tara:strand:- start:2962 stop:4794 length:1833 start_codon:yes stop_codon:yes gene_type:complete
MDNNKLELSIVELAAQTSPVIREVQGKDWIEYGTEDNKNLYPQFLIDLYYNSSTHSAIVNQTAAMIAGDGIIIEDETNLDALVRLKKFINSANSNETLQEVMDKIAFDLKLQGAYALNVIWSKDRQTISEIYHIGVEKIRAGLPNEMGVIDTYYISADWSNTRKAANKPTPIKAFNTKDRTSANQILYSSLYSPMMDVYGTPDYSGCVNWCLTDQMVSEFHLSNIKNGFSGSYFINFNNGVPTREERVQIERQIERKFSGATNAGKFVLTFSDGKENEPTITPISVSNADKQYLALQELLTQNILTGHRVTSPMLMGIKNDTGLGSNVDELNSAFEVYQNTVIKPFQANILKTLAKVFEVNDMNLPISIKQLTPITTKFDNDTLKEVMTQDELRGELGLDVLEIDEQTAEEEIQMSKTPTDEEILEYINSLEVEDEVKIEDEYQLLDEEAAEDENHNYEFAARIPTPTGKKGKSNKDKSLFKIRYVYRGGSPKTNTREFCRTMWNNHYSSLFSREDITGMRNTEFGSYNIFRFKGSYNCRHYWLRRLYVLKKAPRNMTINGKVYQKGDYLPKELKNYKPRNKGYVPSDAGVPPLNSREREASRINDKVVR